MINGLDLFSGIGGLSLALGSWVRPVAYCENDRYAQGVLLSRMASGDMPIAPIWDDIRTLSGSCLPNVDVIYGGFPCQDVSFAGARKGLDGERTGLFREAIRLVRECKPKFVFLENVPGIRKYVFTIRQELEALGYDCRDGFLSAAEVGAPHIRNRWWLLAHANGKAIRKQSELVTEREDSSITTTDGSQEFMADTDSRGRNTERVRGVAREVESRDNAANMPSKTTDEGWWTTEPAVGRVAHGVPGRVDRLRGLGNAVVPAQAKEAFKKLCGIE